MAKATYAVIGDPIAHSLSPLIHNTLYQTYRLDCEYVPLHVPLKDVPAFMEARLGRDIAGCNVTMPDKAAVIPFLSWVQEEASLCQSVNTIAADGRKGWSTDAPGLRRALELEGGGDYQGKTLLLYGAGSAAAAIALDFARNGGKRLYLYNRTEAKAQRIAAFVRENSPLSPKTVPAGCLEAVLPPATCFSTPRPWAWPTGAEFPLWAFWICSPPTPGWWISSIIPWKPLFCSEPRPGASRPRTGCPCSSARHFYLLSTGSASAPQRRTTAPCSPA